MVRSNHIDFILRWVEYMGKNPNWKKYQNKFINAQFQKNEEFISKLLKEDNGEEKIARIYKIKNFKGYPRIFKRKL